jgi:O-antigen ligase
MIRLAILTSLISFLCIYSFKDWYKPLCVLIALMGVLEHPDMPKSIMDIQGLNPWNILLLFILIGRAFNRKHNLNEESIPNEIKWLLIIYFITILISVIRLLAIHDQYTTWVLASSSSGEPSSKPSLISEHIINSFKWVIPAYLLYKGCNSRERLYWGTGAILCIYMLLALQVIKWMPFSNLSGGDALSERALKILVNEIGYHRVNLSMLLAGGSWAIFCTRIWFKKKNHIFIVILASISLLLAVALTGGRTGYVTWALVGMILALAKWRKYIVLAPIPVLLLYMIAPAAFDRLLKGFDPNEDTEQKSSAMVLLHTPTDRMLYSITSGRNVAWPFVFDKISERPLTGYGRLAMVTTGLTAYLWNNYSESFPHPHNLYLEFIFENGILGFIPILIFYGLMVSRSYSLLSDNRSIDYQVAGGVCISLLLAFLFAGIGSQTFYPREGAVGMWCAFALMLRVWVQRNNVDRAIRLRRAGFQ